MALPPLTLVPTPIGNLGDITLRALETLKQVDVILAEDTRTSRKLLDHYQITRPMESFHAHNEHARAAGFAQRMVEGKTFALISDAGTPAISDPGFLLVRECLKRGLEVDCLPGASALLPALVLSGLAAHRFTFEGFLPLKGKLGKLQALATEERTMIFYESPHRIGRTLSSMAEVFGGERQLCIARELSKLHQQCLRLSLAEAAATIDDEQLRGEIVLVVQGAI
jgi:16S rRNA (cytidine1402-2'-O)-methyltransferase